MESAEKKPRLMPTTASPSFETQKLYGVSMYSLDPVRQKMIDMFAKALIRGVEGVSQESPGPEKPLSIQKSQDDGEAKGKAEEKSTNHHEENGSKDGQNADEDKGQEKCTDDEKSSGKEKVKVSNDEVIKNAIFSVAAEIDFAIFSDCKGVNEKYKLVCKRIFSALNSQSHVELRSRLIEGELDPADLIKMTPGELVSPALKRTVAKKEEEKEREEELNRKRIAKRFGTYACRKCRSHNTTTALLQTRRADEGMTLFINCHDCGRTTRG